MVVHLNVPTPWPGDPADTSNFFIREALHVDAEDLAHDRLWRQHGVLLIQHQATESGRFCAWPLQKNAQTGNDGGAYGIESAVGTQTGAVR